MTSIVVAVIAWITVYVDVETMNTSWNSKSADCPGDCCILSTCLERREKRIKKKT